MRKKIENFSRKSNDTHDKLDLLQNYQESQQCSSKRHGNNLRLDMFT